MVSNIYYSEIFGKANDCIVNKLLASVSSIEWGDA